MAYSSFEMITTWKFGGSLLRLSARNIGNPLLPIVFPLSSRASIIMKIGLMICRPLSGSRIRESNKV